MTMSDTRLQSLLGDDPVFISRCKVTMFDVADNILAEAQDTPGHPQRLQYARQVMQSPDMTARTAAPYLARTTNVVAAGISMEDHGVEAAIDDAGLLSQITSSWDVLAGVETGTPSAPLAASAARR